VTFNHWTINDDLVTRPEHENIVLNDFLRVDVLLAMVANNGCAWTSQQSDAVQCPLGSHLLYDTYQHVAGHNAARYQRITHLSEGNECGTKHEQNVVDEGKNVFTRDRAVAARRGRLDPVNLAQLATLDHVA